MTPDKHIVSNIPTQFENLPWYLASIGVIAAKLHGVNGDEVSKTDIIGMIWKLTLVILLAIGTVSMTLAGLGYHSIDKRLCAIESFLQVQDLRDNILEKYQDYRILEQGGIPPIRPHVGAK